MPIDVRFAAGLLEADGWFSIIRKLERKFPSYSPQIGLVQCDVGSKKNMVHDLKELLGGRVSNVRYSKNKQHAPKRYWKITSAPGALAAGEMLLPHIRYKKKQLELVIALSQTIGHRGEKKRRCPEIEEKQRFLYLACRRLNRRGADAVEALPQPEVPFNPQLEFSF